MEICLANAVRILDELFLGSLNARHESLTIPGSYVQAALFRKMSCISICRQISSSAG
jgi:hypothetical protein